ncbi:hypothetical protein AMS68_002230 [Peltaster fructicola]|uniref:Homeobox domain-containing protein n=1 Tax=Peltaster fructicola TaxID=286661 RepID=A0A6H0XPS6_9PEZI|nr:hypothetical protein AMS68_002230 [Peltaster fructicola]
MAGSRSDALHDLDLSFLDDLPPLSIGEDPTTLQESTLDFSIDPISQQALDLDEDFDSATWAARLEQHVTSEPDYTNFDSWIPEFQTPAKPCDYCRSKRLNCYLGKGQTDCYPCMSLFRECSLNSTTMEATNYAVDDRGTFFDALHTVGEDAAIEQGSRTIAKYLKSKQTDQSVTQEDAPGSSRRNGIRFPQSAVKILREWYHAHQDHPYPSEEEKVRLEASTALKPHQIANWLANQRRKNKVLARSRPRRAISPSARSPTPAIDIVGAEKPWEELNPLERWQHSPPENEPAAFENIAEAVASSDLPDGASTPSSTGVRRRNRSSNGSGVSGRRAASTTSAETSRGSSLSAPSSAAQSNSSSHGSFGSFNSSLAGKKDRRRRKRGMPLRQPTDEKRRTFQCTFCTDTFKSKYDWTRHEKSLHLSLEKFICAPLGPCIIDTNTGDRICVYCGLHNPEEGHEDTHNHRACEEKGLESRTFYRKDHLRQHLRLMHGCELIPGMDAWKFTTTNVNSRCGFCAQRFALWQDRVDHLTVHFRAGTRMIDWKGCRGLDPAVAAMVTNAMPPYLIGIESLSPNPFSATNEGPMHVFDDQAHAVACDAQLPAQKQQSPEGLSPKATCWEILTIALGRYANEMVTKGIVLTDEMLQSQARLILYDSDDTWNQTAADNPEWLDLFKKGHGLDLIPSKIGGQGQKVPEDLEWYSDLGVRIPFFVQLEQYNRVQNEEALKNGTGGRARKECRARKEAVTSDMMRSVFHQLTQEGVLHSAEVACPHETCTQNTVDCDFMDEGQKLQRQLRWCNSSVTSLNAAPLAKFIGLAKSGVPVAATTTTCEDTAALRAAKARAKCLENLQWGEVDCCPFREQIDILGDRRDAFNAQQAQYAARKVHSKGCLMEDAANGDSYFPYHRAELPADRARNFATITGPWEDSGVMPQSLSTVEQPATTTGAMMEFLGPLLGQGLPFSTDIETSSMTIPTTTAMQDDILQATDFAMLDTIGDLPDCEVFESALNDQELVSAPRTMEETSDRHMQDELNFDEVFNMDIDAGTN